MSERRSRTLVQRLRSGAVLSGMSCFSGSPVLVEAMGYAELDFVSIDLEHCPTGLETVAQLVRAADAAGITPLVRVPDPDAKLIGRVLDLGAQGIVVPQASLERCKAVLRMCRYQPAGDRGACPVVRSAGYLPKDWQGFATASDNSVTVIPLVEDRNGVRDLESILDLAGIDIVFIGPFDLAISLGHPGANFNHPLLAEILRNSVAEARAKGKYVMTTVGATIDEEYASMLLDAGARLLSFSADVAVFLAACRRVAGLCRRN